MKVCLVTPEFVPNFGGIGTYCAELSRELSHLVDLTVVTSGRVQVGRETTSAEIENYLEDRARIHVISDSSDNFTGTALFQLNALKAMKRLNSRENFDVVHTQHGNVQDLLWRKGKMGPAMITTVHTTIRGQLAAIKESSHLGGSLEESEKWQVALNPILRASEALLFRSETSYLTVSSWMRQQLRALGISPNRIRVTYCGVNTRLFSPEKKANPTILSEAKPTVLFSGRHTLAKGLRVFAKAIPEIHRSIPDARFAFVGGSESRVRSVLEGEQVDRDWLVILGYVPYDELPSIYASVDVAVLPTFYENLPIRLLELMASGVPVVASNVCGIPEAVESGKNGVLVPPGDASRLAEAVVSLLQNQAAARRIGNTARETVANRFDWSITARETIKAYTELLKTA